MTNTMVFFALTLLAGCSTYKPETPLLPQGNMPMTEQEYWEAELELLKR
jgi:outer membrane protein assembly factor BamE (lipoprotein component of BamABCDE complex)